MNLLNDILFLHLLEHRRERRIQLPIFFVNIVKHGAGYQGRFQHDDILHTKLIDFYKAADACINHHIIASRTTEEGLAK